MSVLVNYRVDRVLEQLVKEGCMQLEDQAAMVTSLRTYVDCHLVLLLLALKLHYAGLFIIDLRASGP